MATRYSDIVTLREAAPAYNIQQETAGAWKSFIANDQFNDILRKVLKSVRNNDASQHYSFWIDGTYGSGKSHASAVIQHILCDTIEEVEDYVNQEYGEPQYAVLKNDILGLRNDGKRLLPVNLYGQQKITQESDLSLQIQTEVKKALSKAGLTVTVQTDFDNYAAHVENDADLWDVLIEGNASLKSIAPDRKKLIQELKACNTEVISRIRLAEKEKGLSISLSMANLTQWLIDVQNKLKEDNTGYVGLMLVWDEFTELMRSAVGLRLLNPLQEVTEAFMHADNDSYFLFITHPSAFNSLDSDEATKTKGRYHYIHYNMETVSAFKIMSRKFKVVDPESTAYANLYTSFYANKQDILARFAASSTNPEETKHDLQRVFPLHPYTANLATYYARSVGSSSRSVFQFLACEAVKEFLDDDNKYMLRATITADYLWDYVKGDLDADNLRFAAVTERYNSYISNVETQGEATIAVFKGILLLNELNNIAQNTSVVPSEDNIRALFVGTPFEGEQVDGALEYLNTKSIIQRNPTGLYSIQFSALPTGEIQEAKEALLNKDYRYTYQVVRYGDAAEKELERMLKNVARPYAYGLYGEDTNDYTLVNKIENEAKKSRPYELFFALLVARTPDELNHVKVFAEDYSKDERFKNVTFIVFDTILEKQNYERFIDYMALAQCAQKHGLADQFKAHTKDAQDTITEWFNKLKRGIMTYYLRGEHDVQSAQKITTCINNCVGPTIFSSGPESLEYILTKFSSTYWKKASVKATVDIVLSYNNKSDIINKCGGPAKHIEFLLQDSVNDDLTFKQDVDPNHPLWKVCQEVKNIFDHTNKNTTFNLGEKLKRLSEPPYGLFQSYAGMGMVAFAMRKYIKQLFDTNGRPREAQHLVDDVVEVFKAWEDERESNKLNFQFESKESGELCRQLVKTFNLAKLPGCQDISSLKDARWAILGEYAKSKQYPLWSLKYVESSDNVSKLLDNILKVCEPDGLKNPSLLSETLNQLKQSHLDLKMLLNQGNAFQDGFNTYLKNIEGVNLEEEEIPDALTYIQQNLQGEVGLWEEAKVKDKLKDWRMLNTQVNDSELRCLLSDAMSIPYVSEGKPQPLNSILDIMWETKVAPTECPLWSLCYVDSNPQTKSLVKEIQAVFVNRESLDSQTVIDKLVDAVKNCSEEFSRLINDEDLYGEGFAAFMQGLPSLDIEDDEVQSAEDYLWTHKPELKEWEESSIENLLIRWRLDHPKGKSVGKEEKEELRNKVSSIDPTKAKTILEMLCEEDAIIEILKRYVD